METIITIGPSSEAVEMPQESRERALKVLSLCNEMKNNRRLLIYVGDEPFCYDSSPEFIYKVNLFYPLDLDVVLSEFSNELLTIQAMRIEYMEKIMSHIKDKDVGNQSIPLDKAPLEVEEIRKLNQAVWDELVDFVNHKSLRMPKFKVEDRVHLSIDLKTVFIIKSIIATRLSYEYEIISDDGEYKLTVFEVDLTLIQ